MALGTLTYTLISTTQFNLAGHRDRKVLVKDSDPIGSQSPFVR